MVPKRKYNVPDELVILYHMCMMYQMGDAQNCFAQSVAGSEQNSVLVCL